MEITVKDTLYNPLDSEKYIQKTKNAYNNKIWYRVWIYLEGLDLPYVNSVKYILHPSLGTPDKIVYRAPDNPNCAYSFWTWGKFTVNIQIEDFQGTIRQIQHYLEFENELPKDRFEIPIVKDQKVLLHLNPGIRKEYPIKGGMDIHHNEMRLRYADKYVGRVIYVNYKDANGCQFSKFITLQKGGETIFNTFEDSPTDNYGFVEFLSNEEVFAELVIVSLQFHRG